MNEENIRYYLAQEMNRLKNKVVTLEQDIRGLERLIEDKHEEIAKLKVHYTSLLRTALAYGHEEDDEE